ncbi:hypothetical protein XA68_10495 [Ophiocordyceps unilateralis]|uniref:Uncharacterized protein n=1 Tax=Ophiocordyceps unilateralis TaxID=268505 RepID=A0A2A9P2I0_OPHUN|nr:hypothetical protein XA68_10495 [Ophiocordyceps unilateralis]
MGRTGAKARLQRRKMSLIVGPDGGSPIGRARQERLARNPVLEGGRPERMSLYAALARPFVVVVAFLRAEEEWPSSTHKSPFTASIHDSRSHDSGPTPMQDAGTRPGKPAERLIRVSTSAESGTMLSRRLSRQKRGGEWTSGQDIKPDLSPIPQMLLCVGK